MDWEALIEEILKEYEITPEVYSDNSDAKEFVARILGFPSYEVFEKLPTPEEILDGRGNDLLVGHKIQQLPLIRGCLALMERHFILSDNLEELEIEAKRFVKYVKEHFDYEYIMTAKELMKTWPTIGEHLQVNDDRS